jgi:mannose-1-phosphate guanylyltransferase/phosphomannomutase
MIAIVMAGGEGTRLRPLTCQHPKPLVPIANRPVMYHILNLLKRHNIKKVIATLHYLADEIESYFGDGKNLDIDISYSIEDTPLGTAGSVKKVEDSLKDTFLIISGDGICDFDLTKAISFHKEKNAIATIVLTKVENPLEYGVVITEEDGRIKKFLEKPSWGEVFSDTVNTGIYILQPEVLKYLEKNKQYDFSKDLFPLLLQNNESLFGYIAEGYWCDIGNLQQYKNSQIDVLGGKVKLEIPFEKISPEIWCGENTEISPLAILRGPLLIGNNCKIEANAEIGPFTVIGDNCVVREGTTIERSILWNNIYIGNNSKIEGAIICNNCIIKSNVLIQEGAVIGDKTRIENGANVRQQIKIWPEKIIESGATVSMSLIWGIKWPGSLFSEEGVKGLSNLEISPEFATKLGASFGAYLGKGARVITSRDAFVSSRMIKRAVIAGLMSVGVNVRDLRLMPSPITRHEVKATSSQGGIHVRAASDDSKNVVIEFYDCSGINIKKSAERKIENIFFREDFSRTDIEEIGNLEFSARAIEFFTLDFLKFVDSEAISKANFKIVIDYGCGMPSFVFPTMLGKLKCEMIALNAYVDPTKIYRKEEEKERALHQLTNIVKTLKADMGVLIDSEGEKFSLVSNEGRIISNNLLLLLFAKLLNILFPDATVATNLAATKFLEEVFKGKIIRTKIEPTNLMEICSKKDILFAGDTEGGFIFPKFQPSFDAMVSFAKLLEFLAKTEKTLEELISSLPQLNMLSTKVACPWEQKGIVMRKIIEGEKDKKIELIDGIKIIEDDFWVLIRPHTSEPYFNIYAEGKEGKDLREIVDSYIEKIKNYQI